MHITTLTANPCIDLELVVDVLRREDVSRVRERRPDPGGKGINVAHMLSRLGVAATPVALLGGPTGEQLAALARQAGLDVIRVPVAGETRINITITERDRPGTTRLNMAGPAVTAAELAALRNVLRGLYPRTDYLVLSGSLPPGAGDELYAELITEAHGAGVRCVLDTDGLALQHGVDARPFLVKPNEHELARLTGLPCDDERTTLTAARTVQAQGPAHVIVSLGPAGALWVGAGPPCIARPPRVKAVSTVGCGDALVAGWLWSLSEENNTTEALRTAVALGTAMATTPGTTLCDRDAMERIREQTTVDELKE